MGESDPETRGFGFELTFRLGADADADADTSAPPPWPINFLQNIARYVFSSGSAFNDGHWIACGALSGYS